MKHILLLIGVLCVLALSVSSTPSTAGASNVASTQRATTKFGHPVTLMGTTLLGEYLFVHDDAAMARGEACTRIYKGNAELANKLVISFHCTPVARAMAKHFTLRTSRASNGRSEISEFQFEGSSEGHQVPLTD